MKRRLLFIISIMIFLVSFTSCQTTSLFDAGFDNDKLLDEGWMKLSQKDYSGAINSFESILKSENVSALYVAKANDGLGWTYAKMSGITSGEPYFEKAKDLIDDSKVGLAGVYLSRCKKEDILNGIALLEDIGLASIQKVYIPARPAINVTNAEVHAMLAIFYFYTNQGQKATEQFNLVRTLNSPDDTNVSPVVGSMLDLFDNSNN